MAGKPQLSEDIRSKILKYLQDEKPFNAIRDEIGISLETIHRIAKANGIKRNAGQPKGCEYQPTKYDRECSIVSFTHTKNAESFGYGAF